eukprot:1997173-Rhodomonas_salina.3
MVLLLILVILIGVTSDKILLPDWDSPNTTTTGTSVLKEGFLIPELSNNNVVRFLEVHHPARSSGDRIGAGSDWSFPGRWPHSACLLAGLCRICR